MARVKLTDARIKSEKAPASGSKDVWDTVLPGFGLRVTYGGTKSFQIMVRVGGRQRRKSVGRYPAVTLADARERAREYMEQAEKGQHPEAGQVMPNGGTAGVGPVDEFEKIAARFIEEYQKPRNRTWWRVERQIKSDLVPYWAGRSIRDIRRPEVRALIQEKAAEHPTQANRVLATVRKFFNWCLENDLLETSPAAGVRPPSPENDRERVLSRPEIRAVWGAFGRIGQPFGDVFKLLLLTGQRRSEVANIRVREVDWFGGVWTIPPERAKGGHGHQVPFNLDMRFILNGYVNTPDRTPDDLLFTGRQSGEALTSWPRAKEQVDHISDVTDWRLHDLRRTAATGMATAGVPRHTISRVLNHAEGGVTNIYDRYSYFAEKEDALNRWNTRLSWILEEDDSNDEDMSGGSRNASGELMYV